MDRHLQLTFLKPGLQTTIQDHGRASYRAFGVPQSGPMDLVSAHMANLLVGNPEFNPVLEFSLIGPTIKLKGEGHICVSGAPFKALLNHQPLPQNTTVQVKGSALLTIGHALDGCRAYLAIAGSWELDHWLNSCSTPVNMGPDLLHGSIIRKGSEISVINTMSVEKKSALVSFPKTQNIETIRVLAGPEYSLFSTSNIKDFLGRPFAISNRSNRMGYRLDTPLTDYMVPLEIISSGVVPGTIQVTHSGQLIVLMADAQTIGGYPRIANVVSPDQNKLAQLRPGKLIRFQLVSLKYVS